MKTRTALVVILTIACCGFAVAADERQSPAGAVRADKMERTAEQTLLLTGNVTVFGSSFRLQADSVEVRELGTPSDPATELTARGNVILTRGPERMTLHLLQFNPQTGKGTFQLPPGKN